MSRLGVVDLDEIEALKNIMQPSKNWCDKHTSDEAPDVLAIPITQALGAIQSLLDKATPVSGEPAIAALEARIVELESALEDAIEYADELDWDYKKQYPSQSHEYDSLEQCKAKAAELLAKPTATEHLDALFKEWLGKPVAWTSPCRSVFYRATEDTVYGKHTIALYAPKKASE